MGEVIYMKKQDEGIARFIDSGINAAELIQGEDYQVASFIVLDRHMKSHSLGGFLGKSSNELFQGKESNFEDIAANLIAGKDNNFVFETEISNNILALYRLNEEVDIDLATEIGLGVVRYKKEYLIYLPSYKNSLDAVGEMLMLKVYFQLMHPEEIDQKLKNGFTTLQDVIQSKMIINSAKHMNRLKEIFS